MTTTPGSESTQNSEQPANSEQSANSEQPAKPPRRRVTKAAAAPEPAGDAQTTDAQTTTAPKKRASRSRKPASDTAAQATGDQTDSAQATGTAAESTSEPAASAQGDDVEPAAPRKRASRSRKPATEEPPAGAAAPVSETAEGGTTSGHAPRQGTTTKTTSAAAVDAATDEAEQSAGTLRPERSGRPAAAKRSGDKPGSAAERGDESAATQTPDSAPRDAEQPDQPKKARPPRNRGATSSENATTDASEAPSDESSTVHGAEALTEQSADATPTRQGARKRGAPARRDEADAAGSGAQPDTATTTDAAAADEPQPQANRRTSPARDAEQQIDVRAAFSATDDGPADPDDDPATDDVRLPATALLFQAPEPTRSRRRAQAKAGPPSARAGQEGGMRESADATTDRAAPDRSATEGAAAHRPATTDSAGADSAAAADDSTDEDSSQAASADSGDESATGQRRRRRRGGRGRRNRGGQSDEGTEGSAGESEDDSGAAAQPAVTSDDQDPESTPDGNDDDAEGSANRRRRRRRRSGGSEDAGSASSREGRAARDEITALKGSTRLEAKRQRRRDGRDAGRRRPTISESEFLARREAVDRSMVVRERDGRTQIAVLEDDVLVEHYVARETQSSVVGNVYLGRVQNVLPSMEAAFVDLGKGRNAVLYAGEVNWDAAGMEGQPRRIEQALSSGDPVLVQVTKDPIGHKGARLTSQVTLAGRYLVYVPSGAMTGISRKLPDNERARLKKLLKEIVPGGAGVIVRTAAEGASEEQLRSDVERLTRMWEEIEGKAKSAKSAPVLLKGEPELAVRVVRDVFNEDFRSLTVSGDRAWETISGYVRELSPDLADRMRHWTDAKDIFAAHRIDEQLAKGMDRKVYLPSGGSLVIDRTEAMTVIDVNTGKFTGSGGTLEETVTRNNLEAAEEVVRQLRLRDIGGIIVIDFIDMVLESNRDLVLRRLVECLGRDRTRHQVAEVTSLGLVQMTRKRVGQGLVEAFSETCEHCGGRGFVVHDHPVDKESSGGGDGGSRRRKRGNGNGSGSDSGGGSHARPEPAAAPAEDPQAVAAREAVKATLATIAAAAASAHGDDLGQDEPALDTDPAVEVTQVATEQQALAQQVPAEQALAEQAPAERLGQAPAEQAPAERTSGGRRRGSRRANAERQAPPSAGQAPAEKQAAADIGASLDALAAGLPSGRDAAPVADAQDAVVTDAPVPVVTDAPGAAATDTPATAATDMQANDTPDASAGETQAPPADGPAPEPVPADTGAADAQTADTQTADTQSADTPPTEQQPTQRGKRRPRRVTSGGPVTA